MNFLNIGKENIREAKLSLKSQIKYINVLIEHLNAHNLSNKQNSLIAAFCLHRYFSLGLPKDAEEMVQKLYEQAQEIEKNNSKH